MTKESNILQECRIEASRLGAVVWRNNVGKFQDKNGRWITFGIGNPGGADLIGLYRGVFVAIEIKQPGKKTTAEQENFLRVVRENGGISGVARSPEDVKLLLTNTIK